MKVGLVGLGAMGRGMAASLRRGGHDVHVCDVRAEAVSEFTRHPRLNVWHPVAAEFRFSGSHLNRSFRLFIAMRFTLGLVGL